MSLRSKLGSGNLPTIPRVTSPSPTTPDRDVQEYSGPTTRSRRKANALAQQQVVEVSDDETHRDSDLRRPRTASRSPVAVARRRPKASGQAQADPKHEPSTPNGKANGTSANGKAHGGAGEIADGHLLAPPSPPRPAGSSFWSWRDFSRSPSPLGLIPIHRQWRAFVHQHEVPRKALHVSIGFFVVWLYSTGTQTSSVPPYLMAALVPITTVDWLRHRYAAFNRVYVRVLGALMRESEYAGWNGVIFYLLGAWIVLYFFPKDVGVMSVLLLSWCDTAASTFGRLWGRYTPRLRRGKSLAGSLAACLMGVATSYFFYGWLVPTIGPMPGDEAFMFTGTLSLPRALGAAASASVGGSLALGIVSALYGVVASASEVVDLFGWDDNLTIPVLSGIGMFGFLKLFGQ
ncbi:CTP-dependent diacylglycerol kinase 1 [Escovopsis weberi]|uniref:CTP-dependent diacylglycerol kinase 1 n=1 Tax=Escovopsis weberi TaxID=150374 RepID=A0A0N0RTZ1_ESCWE|nr:CTP-dependent diacylglycerol kinase 1 [Escovopsis weberi]